MKPHLIHPNPNAETLIHVTPESAGWQYLDFAVIALKAGQSYMHATHQREVALVTLSGKLTVQVDNQTFELSRTSVFAEKTAILYVPPRKNITVTASSDAEFSLGGAPAEGKYPVRLFQPDEIKSEMRGQGPATRQVNHILSHPMPAERLILFEVYVEGGHWSGWPPHCHDGYGDSAHLDETYYFRTDPAYGFGMHRNYRRDNDFDEAFPVRNGDLVLVTQGFHSTAAAPNCKLYFLNYLAGELYDTARAQPPYDDPDFVWVKQSWA